MNGRARWLVIALCLACLPFAATAHAAKPDPQEAEAEAAWQALQIELARHLQVRGDARQQLVAAMLLGQPVARDASTTIKAAAAAHALEAQAVFARVRAGTDDPWVLWMVATSCFFGDALCDRAGAIEALLRIESDNAAVWMLALDRAHRANDRGAVLAALQGMAASTRYDQHYVSGIRAWTDAFDALPAIEGFERWARKAASFRDAAPDADELRAAATLAGFNMALAYGFPPFSALAERCIPEAMDVEGLREACRGAARVLVTSDTLVSIAVGLPVAFRFAADDAERRALEQRRLERDWLTESVHLLGHDGFDEAGAIDAGEVSRLVDRLRTAGSEIAMFQSLLRDHGMPLQPPDDYRGNGMDLAQREAERQQRRQQAPRTPR
jgi:hypothetical protein